MSIHQIKAGTLLSYVSLAVYNVIGLLYTPFMLRMLGQSEYGLYSLSASIVAYLAVLDLGFGSAIVRYTAKFKAESKQDELRALWGMFFTLYLIIGLVSLLAGILLCSKLGSLFSSSMSQPEVARTRVILILLVSNLSITFPLSVFGSIITANERFVFQKMSIIVRSILTPCLAVPLLLLGYKALGMVVVITAINVAGLLFDMWYCLVRLRVRFVLGAFNCQLVKEITGYSLFVFLGIVVDRFYWSSGQFILGVVAGTAAVSVYSIGIQMLLYYLGFSMAISGLFLPKVSAMVVNEVSSQEVSDLFVRVGRIQYLIMSLLLSGFVLYGKQFITLWAGPEYSDAYIISLLIMIPLTVPSIQGLGLAILQARNRHRYRSIVYAIIASIGFAISFPLAKAVGGVGCAAATSMSLIVGNVVIMNRYYFRHMKIDIPHFWNEILKMTLPILPLIALGSALNLLHSQDTVASLALKIGVFAALYLLIVWWKVMDPFERRLIRQLIWGFLPKIQGDT